MLNDERPRTIQFNIERGPLIRASKLTTVLSKFTNLAAAAEQTAKQQAAQNALDKAAAALKAADDQVAKVNAEPAPKAVAVVLPKQAPQPKPQTTETRGTRTVVTTRPRQAAAIRRRRP